MSHFTVLVIGDNPEKQLAPYQENNMGDCPKEYLKFVDVTQECKRDYESDTITRIKLETGEFIEPYNEIFRVEGTIGIGTSTHEPPKHLERVQIPIKEIYPDFDAFVGEYCGYSKDAETGKHGYWENPNKKWDWYQLGGRYSGYFLLKDGTKCDRALRKDVDFNKMKQIKLAQAYINWGNFLKSQAEDGFNGAHAWFELGIENIGDRDNFIAEPFDEYTKRTTSIATFAVVKDGQWYERGSMGWFAHVSNENRFAWDEEFYSLVENLPDNTLLSLYDCHI